MNTATMDGSRALYGISKDGMTIKELGVLNRHHVPGRAMTVDAILNIFLIMAFAGVLEILAVSNVGYVFATCTALSAFMLLRRDRPQWPRPIRLPNFWVPLAAVLFLINLTFLVFGGFIYSGGFLGIDGYGYGWDKTRSGPAGPAGGADPVHRRHVVQDKIPLKLREQVPATPEEERAHAELKAAPTAAPSV